MPSEPRFDRPIYVGRPNVGDRARFHQLVDEILDRNWLTNSGPVSQSLEEQIADYLGVRNCVVMANGTLALEIAVRALGISGEVILPSFTFVATAHAVTMAGASPVFADIDPATHNLDPRSVRRRLSDATGAIIGVHLWGRPAPVEELQRIADDAGVPLLFDAAHAFACSHGGRMVGTFGRAEVLSLHATKFFNSLEGGAIVTDDDDLAAEARLMRNFGFAGFDNVIRLGTNAKMHEITAAMGLVNLSDVDHVIAANRANHDAYGQALRNTPGLRLLEFDSSERNNYQYVVVEVDEEYPGQRDAIVEHLHANNVIARRYFWPGCHRMEPYVQNIAEHLPHVSATEQVASRVIVLPTGTAISPQDCYAIGQLVVQQRGCSEATSRIRER